MIIALAVKGKRSITANESCFRVVIISNKWVHGC